MPNEVVYNQVVTVTGGSVVSRIIMRSYAEEGKLILVLDDGGKVFIDGRKVDSVKHKRRIQELLNMARKSGIEVEAKAVMHYASTRDGDNLLEYVLVKW